MSFKNDPIPFDSLVGGIGIAPYSTPTPLLFKDKLYIFYNGCGNDGVWYTTTGANTSGKYTPIVNIRNTCTGMNVAHNTGPSAVVYKGLIYLFYNGLGNDGTWYTTNDGTNDTWAQCKPVLPAIGGGPSFNPGTSSSAAVYDDRIYLVWVGNGVPKGLPCARFDGRTWEKFHTPDLGIGIPPQTSAFTITYKDTLYVFYSGANNSSTYFVRYRSGTWSPAVAVQSLIGPQGYKPGTSPSAAVWGDRLCVMWTGIGNDGVWFTLTDGEKWSAQRQAKVGSDIYTGTTGAVVVYRNRPNLLFVRTNAQWKIGNLWVDYGVTFALDDGPIPQGVTRATWGTLSEAIKSGTFFTIYSYNPILYRMFEKKFKAQWTMPYPPNVANLITFLGDIGTETVDLTELGHLMPSPADFAQLVAGQHGLPVEVPSPGLVCWAMLYVATERPANYNVVVTTDAVAQSVAINFTVNIFK